MASWPTFSIVKFEEVDLRSRKEVRVALVLTLEPIGPKKPVKELVYVQFS